MSAEPRRKDLAGATPPAPTQTDDVDRLVHENLGLVYHAARKLDRTVGPGPTRGDLVSAGVQGLIQAAQSFDPSRGLAFSTLAVPRIKGAMLDELRRWDQTPRSVRRKERDIKTVEAELQRHLGRHPTPGEVADELGIGVEELHGWQLDLNRHVSESLDSRGSRGDEHSRRIAERVPDDAPDAIEMLGREEAVAVLGACLRQLPERDGKVLALYYYEGLRLREIAQLMGVTESRISQIRHAALKTLRALLIENGVEP